MTRNNLSNRNTNRRELENLEAAPGYVSTGEGQWSRQAGSGGKVETISLADTSAMSKLELLIHRNTRELINLSERLATETDPVAVMKINKSMAIKSRFLAKLREEQRHA
jgi:hypothetical protein